MTARRRRICRMRNFVDRLPGHQARLKDQKVDVLQYPGEEIPAGTIFPARHFHQIQRDPLATPQLCWRRAGAIAFEKQFTRKDGSRSCMSTRPAHECCRQYSPAYCEKTPTPITPACFMPSPLWTAHVLLIFCNVS